MSSDHCMIPPSSAFRRVLCPGSAIMELMHPETTESEEAMEGTAAHELAEKMIVAYSRGGIPVITPEEVIGATASNGVIWTREMYEGAKMYADECLAIMQSTGNFAPHVEKRVTIERIHPELWGTPDFWLFDRDTMTLRLPDFKFGRRVVEAFENYQLIEYGVGILDQLGIDGWLDQQITVVFTIVQPRAYHRAGPVRRWTVQVSELRGYINQLEEVERQALSGEGPCVAGAVQCRDCSARRACETLQQSIYSIGDWIGSPTPAPLSGDELAIELAMVREFYDQVKARKTGLEAQASEMIRRGDSVKGFSIEPGRGSTKWSSPVSDVIMLGDMMGVNLRKPEDVITPKQAVAAGIDESVIKAYSSHHEGALKLVRTNETLAHAVFTKEMK